MTQESQLEVPADLGRRIVQAARMAVAMHCLIHREWNSDFGRQPKTGRAESGEVMDDLSTGQRELNAPQAALPSPWTLAGEDPAGSFH